MDVTKFLFVAAFLLLTTAEKVRYDNYKVYRLIPNSEEHLKVLSSLEDDLTNGYDFWTDPSFVGKPVDIMVPPKLDLEFSDMVEKLEIPSVVYIEDVQQKIDMERAATRTVGNRDLGWEDYYTLEEIYDWLGEVAANYTNATLVKGGKTYEGRDILGVNISFSPNNINRTVFIEGGIHAREWISPATVTYLINEILSSSNATTRALLQSFNWYLFPVFNPDGYSYTWTSTRLWRKTRVPYGTCYGADPNRNWNTSWMSGGASANPCRDTYAGPEAFSEPETKSLSDFISNIGSRLIAYISFHSFSQLLMHPFGNTTEHLGNYDELQAIGLKAAQSLAARYGTSYTVGNIAETIYIASGGSIDWVKDIIGTRIVYVYELRDTGRYGFLLPADQIIPNSLEVLDSIITILEETLKLDNSATIKN